MVRAVGLDIGGVDILEANDGRLYALEANANFGFYPRTREVLDALAGQVRLRAAASTPNYPLAASGPGLG
jgi:glutathione synthase/RimK-type ligase-like ATP-grasp enzyme